MTHLILETFVTYLGGKATDAEQSTGGNVLCLR